MLIFQVEFRLHSKNFQFRIIIFSFLDYTRLSKIPNTSTCFWRRALAGSSGHFSGTSECHILVLLANHKEPKTRITIIVWHPRVSSAGQMDPGDGPCHAFGGFGKGADWPWFWKCDFVVHLYEWIGSGQQFVGSCGLFKSHRPQNSRRDWAYEDGFCFYNTISSNRCSEKTVSCPLMQL